MHIKDILKSHETSIDYVYLNLLEIARTHNVIIVVGIKYDSIAIMYNRHTLNDLSEFVYNLKELFNKEILLTDEQLDQVTLTITPNKMTYNELKDVEQQYIKRITKDIIVACIIASGFLIIGNYILAHTFNL